MGLTVNSQASQLWHLEVFHPMFNFEQFHIEIDAGGKWNMEPVRAFHADLLYPGSAGVAHFVGEYTPPSTLSSSSSGTTTRTGSLHFSGLRCNGIKQVYEEREPFNIMSTFKNPMVLITVGMMGLMYCMPKPDKLEEMRAEISGGSSEGRGALTSADQMRRELLSGTGLGGDSSTPQLQNQKVGARKRAAAVANVNKLNQ